MPVVTLTSDFGNTDYYLALLKGNLCQLTPTPNVIDITHFVPHYDIVRASFILKNSFLAFPKGSIHIVCVKNYFQRGYKFVVLAHRGHYFIGPDNGIFSLAFDYKGSKIYHLDYSHDYPLAFMPIFARAVQHILSEKPLEEIAVPIEKLEERITLQPVKNYHLIRGSVIHIDNYGNIIVNITKDLFEETCKGRKFELFFKRYDPICSISKHYFDVPIGEVLCLFNSSEYLEIAINMGNAAELFGLQIDDTIQLNFGEAINDK